MSECGHGVWVADVGGSGEAKCMFCGYPMPREGSTMGNILNKPCVDCRHSSWPSQATGCPELIEVSARCSHPRLADHQSVVTGEAGAAPCLTTRIYGGCGELGLWWEPRKGVTGA